MARLDVRLSDSEKAGLVALAAAEGLSLSAFVRARLLGRVEVAEAQEGLRDVLDDHESRLSRLEGMAGL